jgi:hypothetical protein
MHEMKNLSLRGKQADPVGIEPVELKFWCASCGKYHTHANDHKGMNMPKIK